MEYVIIEVPRELTHSAHLKQRHSPTRTSTCPKLHQTHLLLTQYTPRTCPWNPTRTESTGHFSPRRLKTRTPRADKTQYCHPHGWIAPLSCVLLQIRQCACTQHSYARLALLSEEVRPASSSTARPPSLLIPTVLPNFWIEWCVSFSLMALIPL